MNVTPSMSTPSNPPSRPLTPAELALVATVHMDRESFRTLRDLLVALSPSVIATEMSAYGIRFRRTRGRQIQAAIRRYLRRSGSTLDRAGELAATMILLRFPFEYLAARQAARKVGVPIVNLGRDRDSAAWLGRLGQAEWDERRMAAMAAAPRNLKAELDVERRRAVGMSIPPIRPGPRDRVYARRIGGLAKAEGGVAAVLGWEHVAPRVSGNAAWILHDSPLQIWIVSGGKVYRSG